jgi:hypothetical protein
MLLNWLLLCHNRTSSLEYNPSGQRVTRRPNIARLARRGRHLLKRYVKLLFLAISQNAQGDGIAGARFLERSAERFDAGHRLAIDGGDDIAADQDAWST